MAAPLAGKQATPMDAWVKFRSTQPLPFSDLSQAPSISGRTPRNEWQGQHSWTCALRVFLAFALPGHLHCV